MDDIYFSDKRNDRDRRGKNEPTRDRIKENNYQDISSNPTLKKRTGGKFTVNIPDEELNFDISAPEYNQRNRTPQGKKASDIPTPPSRTPQGSRVMAPPPYTPTQSSTPTERPLSQQRPTPPPQRRVPYEAQRPQKRPAPPPPKKKKKVGGKIALSFFALFVILLGAVFIYGWSVLGEINYDKTITENQYLDENNLLSSSSVKNILILGSDARGEIDGQRADTMILFSIDKKNKQIKLTSFLRDSYVFIPGYYNDKLNAAFNYGGPQLTMDTLEYNFGVKIDNYIIIDFNVFTELVDLLGGVPVDITAYEADYMVNSLKFIYIKEGINNLNGTASLWYCRMRYLDNDFSRTERQRKFITALIGKVAKTNPLDLLEIVKQVVPNIGTDISKSKLISLGVSTALNILTYDVVQQQIPAEGTWWDQNIGGADCIVFNEESNRDVLEEFVFGKVEKE